MGLTSEQQLAVDKKDTNIIVSAGAGSGKTTVLKERVLRELKDGVKVTDLIILTFTNNAAAEMKERIRKIINNNPEVADQADLIDSAYITTFDSYAQSLVKKYNYLLNMSKNFTIIDPAIVNTEKNNIIDEIFERKYADREERFTTFIKDFCVKDDKEIRSSILGIYNSLSNVINKEDYLNNYIDTFFSDEYIDEIFNKYETLVFRKRDYILDLLDNLNDETNDNDKIDANNSATANFRYSSSIDELIDNIKFSLARKTEGLYSEEGLEIKDNISSELKNLSKYLTFKKKDLIDNYLLTKPYIEEIIDILNEIDTKIMAFKNENNMFEFGDIAMKAIDLVENNESVRNEIKNSTFEIMIDEYQDTNDIQEKFISLIQNNNVYCVGDIKQSIYRFRNANPYIFKSKYDRYRNGEDGFKIDLTSNFRSRHEVIDNINMMFDYIMDDEIGGADYKKEHNMMFGNKTYDEINVSNTNYDMDILTYGELPKGYKKDEVEAFIIANDIKNKIKNKYQITRNENDKFFARDCDYSDFVVLVDKSTNFDLLKKVFVQNGIPTVIDKDISIKDEDEIYLLKNIINLLIGVKNKKYDNAFKHYYASISRSYLFSTDDNILFDELTTDEFMNSELFNLCNSIIPQLDSLSNKDLLFMIIDKFKFYEKIISVGDYKERITKLEYFVNNATDLNNFGYDIYGIGKFFDELLSGENDVKMSLNTSSGNSVKIMTIHKSKGLEYDIVYLPYLDSDFTKKPMKSKWFLSNKFGIISPYANGYIGNTFVNILDNKDNTIEEISEKIRLFYVAVTRAKDKIILINHFDEKIKPVNNILSYNDKENVKSISMLLGLIKNNLNKYIINIDLDTIGLNKDYNIVKDSNYKELIDKSDNKLVTNTINIDSELLENKHFSKSLKKLIDKQLRDNLNYGIYMHYIFECSDLKTGIVDGMDITDQEKEFIKNFLSHDELKNVKNADIYKEHEIRFNLDGSLYHGFIDLLLVYPDHADIIDYKLSNIDSPEYEKQLNGYKDYIERKYNKKTNIYLYSARKDILKKLNKD